MAELISPAILKGFRDSLPQQELPKRALMARLARLFESFGFLPIDTPVLELTEVLLGKGGGETDKQVYRFRDPGDRDVSMRFDLTVPLARFVAAHAAELPLPFKRYHMAKVWRGENTQRGRYREFLQCDFDIVGADTPAADFEILLLMMRCMDALVEGRATIRLSHRGLFNQFLSARGHASASVEVLRAVDKLAKIGPEAVRSTLEGLMPAADADAVLAFVSAQGPYLEVLATLERLAGGPGEATARLRAVHDLAAALGWSHRLVLDPSITRGLDYYTGLVYETFLDELPALGSVMSGGRYNNLAALYTKQDLPGIGASVGLDRLLAGLEELGRLSTVATVSQVLVLAGADQAPAFAASQALRDAGLNAELTLTERKPAQHYKYAEAKGIRFVALPGPAGLTVKDTASGQQRTELSATETAAWVKSVEDGPDRRSD